MIVFDGRGDVSEKTMKVTVPSLPKENGVPVKITVTVIELRSPQEKVFLAKIIMLDFTGECFKNRIVVEYQGVKKLKRLSQKTQKIRAFGWKYSFVTKIIKSFSSMHSWLQKLTCLLMYYFVYSSFG